MRNNPERLAWVILLSSFFVCVTLSVMIPMGARRYVRRSTATQHVSLQIQRGPLSVVRGGQGRPVSVAEDTDNVLESSRIEAPNATSGRLVIGGLQSQPSCTPMRCSHILHVSGRRMFFGIFFFSQGDGIELRGEEVIDTGGRRGREKQR